MALQTSGAISFSQIASEFGGAGSHSLSEYYPLLGQGVTGIPGSGTISFSNFHGKSKNVTTSVWTVSSSSSSAWVYTGQVFYILSDPHTSLTRYGGSSYLQIGAWSGSSAGYAVSSRTVGNDRWRQGSYRDSFYNHRTGDTVYQYYVAHDSYVTTVTDTSAYVNTASIASITT